jgi:hypothetical protein
MNLSSVTYTWNVRIGAASGGRAAWRGWPLVFSSNFHIKQKQKKKNLIKRKKPSRPYPVSFVPSLSSSLRRDPAPNTLEDPRSSLEGGGPDHLPTVGPRSQAQDDGQWLWVVLDW